ncbi:Acyl-CoA N-acyltransferase [Penicillium bovifimosum]|uniref:Acyl-CoA N-acyltransferase n=1 Tax=Penicillium bovifimosum TaxID=126998 RepID=A0A9W9H9J4_9EURO|nr:Acyl-CoA N-acyltransferase [Penicillium bovifimosum]KAJ5142571.1 Acyl-CoA N-acyltransferase [Penicillium bovifimosum]
MAVQSIPITHGGEKRLNAVAQLNGRVFDTDPVIAYMLLELSAQERRAYLPAYWTTLVKSALLNQAVITEADGWKAASVILPPGRSVDNIFTLLRAGFLGILWRIGFPGLKRLWCEFSGMTDNAKRKGLRGQKQYYYVFSLGTEREHRGKGEIKLDVHSHLASPTDLITPAGLGKAIMREHQQAAQAANLPIWLEATTASSRGLYLSLGFQEVEEIVLGKGKVAADASLQPGGPGVSMWAMVWWPRAASESTS